ncbi:MAG: glycosyltransferase family 2 protein [Pedobacter sp.]|nr:glycosyltransferase family 2 protein [Pedobacter sp.]
MVEAKKSISVVLPNYNGKNLMEMYIPSTIEALNFSKIDYEFIIIDDCSTDNSIAFIEETYPDIIVLKNKSNNGFSFTCNQGIQTATKDLIFLLNSDVKLTPNYFENQLHYFNLESTFGVMGRIMNFDGKRIEDAARAPYYKGAKFKANTFYYVENSKEPMLTCYLSGANALINRRKLVELSGFNEIYSPFYFEDFDLGLRAWQMDWFLYYEHQSICYHQVSSSTNKMNKSNFVKIIYHRNSLILQSIHLKGIRRKLWFLQVFTSTLTGHLIKGEFWVFKSIHLFLNMHNEILKSRSAIGNISGKRNLDDIISIIKQSLEGKSIKWL